MVERLQIRIPPLAKDLLVIEAVNDGEFVRHSDYAALEAQLAEMKAENERLRSELRVYNSDCQYPGCYCTTICDEVATEVLFRTGVVNALEWEDCSCGECGRSYPVNFGTFYEGSGFDPIERDLMDRAFAALAEARKALEPFASAADKHHSGYSDSAFSLPIIKVEHLRAARRALTGGQEDG